MNNNLVKFFRHEANKLIIIPTADGVKFIDNNNAHLKAQNGTSVHFRKGVEKIAGNEVQSYEVTLDASILHISYQMNVPMNKMEFRIFTSGQVNYYWNVPYSLEKARYQEVPS